jgi:hypothetical protein
MDGKFDKSLALSTDKKVEARGPINWGDDDTAVSLYVAIIQDEVVAVGRTDDDLSPGTSKFVVEATVDGDDKLQEGPAVASGWAFVRGDGFEAYSWSVAVTLSRNPAPKRDRSGGMDDALAGQLAGKK